MRLSHSRRAMACRRCQHKARVFASALGITAGDADFLRRTLLRAAQERECVASEADRYGRRYTLDFELRTASGKERIRSGWIVRTGEAFPRLTTCYVVKAKRTER
jgi:hypothetical protein